MPELNARTAIGNDVGLQPRATYAPGALILLAVAAGLVGFSTRADPDLWGHLRFGLDALRDHRLAAVDPYSFTQDVAWVNHEWLSEVATAFAYQVGGTLGLALLKALLTTSTLTVAWAALSGVATGPRVLSIVLIAWSGLPLTGTLRPQLWSWLLYAAVLALLPRRRGRWAIPALFACWANLHGGWIVGLGLVGIWTCATRTRTAVVVLAASALATLLTPYGIGLWIFLANTVRLGRADIQEWQPVWTAPAITWMPTAGAWFILLWGALRRQHPKMLLIGCAALGVAAIRVMRLDPFFVMAVAIWLPRRTWPAWSPLVWVDALAAVVVFVAALIMRGPQLSCLPISGEWTPDLTVNLVGRGTLLVPFDWGQYAIWQWGPQLRVSVDGRRETVYSDSVVEIQSALRRNDRGALTWLDAHRPDLVWYPRQATMVREHLLARGYRVLLETPRSYVLAAPASQATASSRVRAMCFPGS